MPHARRLARVGVEPSRAPRLRVQWRDYYEAGGRNAALTCRHFGISRQTFYQWRRRYDRRRLESLEEGSHRPKHLRQPTWSRELALAVLLRERGWQVSNLQGGAYPGPPEGPGVLREPVRSGISTPKQMWQRPSAVRKPRG